MGANQLLYTLASASLYAVLIFCIVLLFALLGSTLIAKKSDLRHLLLALPVGSTFFYAMTVVIYKFNLGEWLAPLLAALAIVVFYARFKCSKLSAREFLKNNAFHYTNLRFTFIVSSIAAVFATSFFILQLFVSGQGLPLLTSFDTSSGDMFFYLNFADHIRNVGWDGYINQKFDSTPFNDGLEVPSAFGWDHGGTGLVLISALSALLKLQVWQVGQAVLLSMWLVLIAMSSSVIARFTKISTGFSLLISILLFCNFAYLTLLGWWALNQLVFSGVFLLILYLVASVRFHETRMKTIFGWGLISALVALATETYPSIATYGLLPIFAVTFVFALYQEFRKFGWKASTLLLALLPLLFLALGTGEFIPRLFRDQFGNKLDIGVRAPHYLQFLGFPPVVEVAYGEAIVRFLDLLLSPAVFGSACLFLVWKAFRNRRLDGSRLGFTLTVLGASSLLIYSALNVTSYHSHKLALQWIPFVVISLSVIFGDSISLPGFRVVREGLVAIIVFVLIGNSLAWQAFASGFLSSAENRQLHSISKEILELKSAIQSVKTRSVLMDMSRGKSWLPKDRTVSGGLVSYPGVRIDSSWKLSGYPYYTGWTVAENNSSTQLTSKESIIELREVNEEFSLVYVCRLVCSKPEDEVMALVAGLEVNGNEFNQYSGTMSDALSSPLITLYVESEPGKAFSYTAKWVISGLGSANKCKFKIQDEVLRGAEIVTGSLGYSRVRLFSPGEAGCDSELREVTIEKKQ